jgi:hypothetical protein
MLKVIPDERSGLEEVCAACEHEHKKPKIDPYLIMDDIIEKLKLVDYENLFCKKYGKR